VHLEISPVWPEQVLVDFNGLAVASGNPDATRLAPAPLLAHLVNAGYLGRTSGHGCRDCS
jgi:hypothetical protein